MRVVATHELPPQKKNKKRFLFYFIESPGVAEEGPVLCFAPGPGLALGGPGDIDEKLVEHVPLN